MANKKQLDESIVSVLLSLLDIAGAMPIPKKNKPIIHLIFE